jgi:hypothetical protein
MKVAFLNLEYMKVAFLNRRRDRQPP